MQNRYISFALQAACLLSVLPRPACAQSGRELGVWVESHGSVPPIPEWFNCVQELRGKPYDKARSRTCLDLILSHPEIPKGKFSLKHHKHSDALTFYLESPSLFVNDVDLGISAGDLAQVHGLLAVNGNALRPGEAYESDRDSSTWLVLDLLLRSQGRRA